MDTKMNPDSSFYKGFFAGILLSFIIVAISFGFSLGLLRTQYFSAKKLVFFNHDSKETSVPSVANKNIPVQGPESAPIKLLEFADFHCAFCRHAMPTINQLMEKFPGKIRREFHHFPLSETPGQGSFLTHEWSACAQEQGKFWEFHNVIYSMPQAPLPTDLPEIVKKTGLSQTKLEACVKSGKYLAYINEDRTFGVQKGINGTPMFFLNDQKIPGAFPLERFSTLVNDLLSGKPMPGAPTQAPPAAPQPPPTNVTFDDLKDRPSRGPENAKILLVEFSDFHCPFCQRVEPTLKELEKNFPGKIRRVWRHYPLPFHEGAEKTHQASECAHEQGKFWEYHDRLFENFSGSRDEAALIQMAKDLKLDKSDFEKCMKSDKSKAQVKKDFEKGNQVGVSGTPAVFVNGQLVEGAMPYPSFEKIVKDKLNG